MTKPRFNGAGGKYPRRLYLTEDPSTRNPASTEPGVSTPGDSGDSAQDLSTASGFNGAGGKYPRRPGESRGDRRRRRRASTEPGVSTPGDHLPCYSPIRYGALQRSRG